jgi:hypothetical protein
VAAAVAATTAVTAVVAMTEAAERRSPSAPARRGPDRLAVAGFSLTAFFLVLALLGSQLRGSAAATPKRPPSVIVRRVYLTTVVEWVPAGAPARTPPTRSVTQTVSAPSAPAQPRPVVTRSSQTTP